MYFPSVHIPITPVGFIHGCWSCMEYYGNACIDTHRSHSSSFLSVWEFTDSVFFFISSPRLVWLPSMIPSTLKVLSTSFWRNISVRSLTMWTLWNYSMRYCHFFGILPMLGILSSLWFLLSDYTSNYHRPESWSHSSTNRSSWFQSIHPWQIQGHCQMEDCFLLVLFACGMCYVHGNYWLSS